MSSVGVVPIILAVIVTVLALLAFRWFERYRYRDTWRKGEFRAAAFAFLMWFGGLFGHRVPPPPQSRVEFTSRRPGGPALPQDTADKKD